MCEGANEFAPRLADLKRRVKRRAPGAKKKTINDLPSEGKKRVTNPTSRGMKSRVKIEIHHIANEKLE